jgi:hypothetical protein
MSSPLKIALCLFLIVGTANAYTPAPPAPQPFRYSTDTFSFANETVWNYVGGKVQAESGKGRPRDYTRHCFTLTRAAVQFWKFAHFDPSRPPLKDDQLAARIRQVTERSVWLPALSPADRISFPGFSSLRALSAAKPGIFQANIGLGWPIYVRPGNMPIAIPVTRTLEARLNDEILRDLRHNTPTILWLYLFPSLKINHVVVVYAGSKRPGGDIDYQVYDPNYSDAPKKLRFAAATRTFSYQPTFYFKGGEVTARAIYRGLLQ